jgi:uncharacterized membrane protein YqhA
MPVQQRKINAVIGASRYLIIIAVICIFIAAITLLVYGSVLTVQTVWETASKGQVSSKGAKALLLAFIELVDLFLLSTVMYITALGLYELFIHELPLPDWLVVTSLDTLKDKLIGVVIVVLAVVFLGQVITWDGDRDLLGYGAAIALVIATLAYFLKQKPEKLKQPAASDKAPEDAASGEQPT